MCGTLASPQPLDVHCGSHAVLTASDIGLAAGLAAFGEAHLLHGLDSTFIQRCVDAIEQMIADSVDRMKISAAPVPLIAVGGGSFLVPDALAGVSQVLRAPHYAVPSAYPCTLTPSWQGRKLA